MDDKHDRPATGQPTGNHRQWDRERYRKKLTLELDGGRAFPGMTKDLSLSGLLVELDRLPEELLKGERGVLRLESGGEELTFPCKVVRVQGREVALTLEAKQYAAFGMAMTHDIFSGIYRR